MRYRFDPFILDTNLFELRKNGTAVHAEPQVIALLALLIERRAYIVSKDDLLNTIWHGRVVSESALSSRIKLARKLLDDDGQQQRYIRTVHKKGFRFIADVTVLEDDKSVSVPETDNNTATVHSASRPAVAVLPFTNLSDDHSQEYFSDGMTDEIIAQLSLHRWLDVVARNTTYGFKGKAVDIGTLGATLHVHYVVDGSVQRAGHQVRISVHLIDAASSLHLWSERFDRTLDDIFALQDEITAKIVARIEPEIGLAERRKIIRSRPANLQAWDCYHLGIYHFYRFTDADNVKAQTLLQKCQQLDPQFGESYAWWAYAVVLGMVYWNTTPSQALLDDALAACDRALTVDERNASFHALRARVLLARREYVAAITANETAIALNPTLAVAYCGLGDSLAYECRYEDAIQRFEEAIALSPNDPQLWAFYTYGALALLFKGDFPRALEWTELAANIPNCQYWTTAHRAVALLHLERPEEAQAAVQALLREAPNFSRAFAREKLFYLKAPQQIEFYLNSLDALGIR